MYGLFTSVQIVRVRRVVANEDGTFLNSNSACTPRVSNGELNPTKCHCFAEFTHDNRKL